MQTFLPYKSFIDSLECLDDDRLGKQRVEAMQIVNALTGERRKTFPTPFDDESNPEIWKNHTASRMWKDHIPALRHYHNLAIDVWVARGKQNYMDKYDLSGLKIRKPYWLYWPEFCASHRAALLFKFPEHYSQFGWTEKPELNYIWPIKKPKRRITNPPIDLVAYFQRQKVRNH